MWHNLSFHQLQDKWDLMAHIHSACIWHIINSIATHHFGWNFDSRWDTHFGAWNLEAFATVLCWHQLFPNSCNNGNFPVRTAVLSASPHLDLNTANMFRLRLPMNNVAEDPEYESIWSHQVIGLYNLTYACQPSCLIEPVPLARTWPLIPPNRSFPSSCPSSFKCHNCIHLCRFPSGSSFHIYTTLPLYTLPVRYIFNLFPLVLNSLPWVKDCGFSPYLCPPWFHKPLRCPLSVSYTWVYKGPPYPYNSNPSSPVTSSSIFSVPFPAQWYPFYRWETRSVHGVLLWVITILLKCA